MSEWRSQASAVAKRLTWRGRAGCAATIAILIALAYTPGLASWSLLPGYASMIASLLLGAISLHLLFDATLFRLAALSGTENDGLAAIDRVLSLGGCRAMPETVRPLADRIAGTDRILRRQAIAFAVTAALFGAHLTSIALQETMS